MSILVATDLSESSRGAMELAARRAQKLGTSLGVLHCLGPVKEKEGWREMLGEHFEDEVELRDQAMNRLKEQVESALSPEAMPERVRYLVEFQDPSEGIIETADHYDYDLITIGAGGRGRLASMVLGSTAEYVVRSTDMPVLTTPSELESTEIDSILAPVDFSDCSLASLRMARDWAREYSAKLVVLHSYMLPLSGTSLFASQFPPNQIQKFEQKRWERFDEFVENVDLEGVESDINLSLGNPYHVIVDYAQDNDIDLISMGTHGRKTLERFFLGSNATQVLRQMPCPVLTVRRQYTPES